MKTKQKGPGKTRAFSFDLLLKIPSHASPNRVTFVALPDVLAGANAYFCAHDGIRTSTPRARRTANSPEQDALVVFTRENAASLHKSAALLTLQLSSCLNRELKFVNRVAPDTAAFVH